MSMRPFKTFLFILAALCLLAVFPLIAPDGKLKIYNIEFRIYKLDFLIKQTSTYLPEQDIKKDITPDKNVKPFLSETAETKKTEDTQEASQTGIIHVADSPPPEFTGLNNSDILIPASSEYNWRELSEKFLNAGLSTRPLRILYYGDSQIENDRVTSGFRKVLQEYFGGAGRGLVPVESIYNTANNFIMSTSDNWQTTSLIRTKQAHLDLGLLCESFHFNHPASIPETKTNAWIKIKSIKPDINSGYSIVSLFYRAEDSSTVSVSVDGNLKVTKELAAGAGINELRFNLGETPKSVKMEFLTLSGITIYGLNLESPTGIMVDNIALRGRAYPEFSRIDTTRLKQMADYLEPSFIVLQYGVNVVPNITNDYSYYKRHLNHELSFLKKILPRTPVLLVSVSDMARKVGGELKSYPNITKIINAQKEVAMENGCAFWNLFETMGGKGSMISWVERQPPLGNKDYVHYTPLGAEKVGNTFAQQFIKAIELNQATASLPYEP